jgi:hypothetical protein
MGERSALSRSRLGFGMPARSVGGAGSRFAIEPRAVFANKHGRMKEKGLASIERGTVRSL